MSFGKALTEEQEKELVVDYQDGFRVVDLSRRYDVSIRTVHRILSDYGAPRKDGKKRSPDDGRVKEKRKLKPCGTNAAYQRHRARGEYCILCSDAHAKQQKEWQDARNSHPRA